MNILLVDDHALFRAGMRHVLLELDSETKLFEARSCEDALRVIARAPQFDLALLDLCLPGVDGMTGLRYLQKHLAQTPIVILSASEKSTLIFEAIDIGAKGYVPKSSTPEIMINALNLVLSGGVYLPIVMLDAANSTTAPSISSDTLKLTARQLEVLILLAKGNSNKEISNILQLSEGTVRIHVTAILKALRVKNRSEAGYKAMQLGLVTT